MQRVDEDVPVAYSGDNVKLRLKGIEEEVEEGKDGEGERDDVHLFFCYRTSYQALSFVILPHHAMWVRSLRLR